MTPPPEPTYERLAADELAMSPPELLRHVRTIVDGANFGEDLPLVWLSEALERLDRLTFGACSRDTDGDGNCPACAKNPASRCRVLPGHGDGDCPPTCELPGPHSLGAWPFGGVQVGDVPDDQAVRRTLDWNVPYEETP